MRRLSDMLPPVVIGLLLLFPMAVEAADDLTTEADQLIAKIADQRAQMKELRAERDESEGEDSELAGRRLLRLAIETLDDLGALVDNVVEQEAQGLDATRYRQPAEELVNVFAPLARTRISEIEAELAELREERESTSGEERVQLEATLEETTSELTTVLDAALDNVEYMGQLGLDDSSEREFLAETLADRAEKAGERLRLAAEQIDVLQERVSQNSEAAELKADLAALKTKQETAQTALGATIEMMKRLDLDTTVYQQLRIESTGQINSDILNSRVAVGLVQRWLEGVKDAVVENGPRWFFRVVIFFLILFVFRLLARAVRRVVARAVAASKLNFSRLLQNMFISTSGRLVMLIGLLVALSQMGFALGPILAGLGIVGFIVGFALQETLANFAAGMMILIYRPYDVNDLIEAAGAFGRVSAMSMVSTTVLTIDNQTLVIPNGKIWGDVIKNVTAQTVRRIDMTFGVSYTDDIPKTEEVLADIVKANEKVLDDPAPVIRLHNLGDSSVDFVVRPWVRTDDYWQVYWEITREVKMRFDREGISIPFPQRDVHLYAEKRETTPAATEAD